MARPPRWTKTQFLAWFEEHHKQLLRLTTRRFGGELQACGLTAEDALHTALMRSLRKRHYQTCRTTMRQWFLNDVKWAIRDEQKQAERTVPLDPPRGREGRFAGSEMLTDGDDAGQIEFAVASDDLEPEPATAKWMWCDELPPFIKACTHRHHEAIPGRDCPAYEWATYQLELRHRARRRRLIHRPASRAFWPEYRAAGDRLPVPGQQRDQRPWKQALRRELWNYRNRLEALQVEAADIEKTTSDGLARCTGRGSRNWHQLESPVPSCLSTH